MIQKHKLLILYSLSTRGWQYKEETGLNVDMFAACLVCQGMPWSQEELWYHCRCGGINAVSVRGNEIDFTSLLLAVFMLWEHLETIKNTFPVLDGGETTFIQPLFLGAGYKSNHFLSHSMHSAMQIIPIPVRKYGYCPPRLGQHLDSNKDATCYSIWDGPSWPLYVDVILSYSS